MDVEYPNAEIGVPILERILQHCDRALQAIFLVLENDLKIVPGQACRNEERYSTVGTKNRGGFLVKNYELHDSKWLHPFVRDIRTQKIEQMEISFRDSVGRQVTS